MKLSDLESIHNHSEFKRGLEINRRHFLSKAGLGLGGLALASLSNPLEAFARMNNIVQQDGITGMPHFVPKAKRVIYLFQSVITYVRLK